MRRLTEEQDALVSKYGARVTLKQVKTEMPGLSEYETEIVWIFFSSRCNCKHCGEVRGIFFILGAELYNKSIYPEPEKVVLDRFLRKPGEERAMRNAAFDFIAA